MKVMAERFPWDEIAGPGTPEQKKRWLLELEKAGVAKIRVMLSPGTGVDLALGGPQEVPKGYAAAWIAWHDQLRAEAERKAMVRSAQWSAGAAIAAAVAAFLSLFR